MIGRNGLGPASLAAIAAIALALGCSSSSSGDGTGAAGAATGAGGSGTGAAGSTGAGASGPIAGLTYTSCLKKDGKECDTKGESTASAIDDINTSCTSDGGTVSDHCPTAGLIGCCAGGGAGICSYDPSAAPTIMMYCMSPVAWTTTPP